MVIGNIWQRLALLRLDFGAQNVVRRAKSQAWGNCVLQSAPAPTTAHCNQRHHVMTTNLEFGISRGLRKHEEEAGKSPHHDEVKVQTNRKNFSPAEGGQIWTPCKGLNQPGGCTMTRGKGKVQKNKKTKSAITSTVEERTATLETSYLRQSAG